MTSPDDVRKNYDYANLSGSDLSEADLANTSLRRTRLDGATLRDARLVGSDLHGASLDRADVTGADLRDADLTDSSLHGVDLSRAATDGIRLAGARGLPEEETTGGNDRAVELHMAQTAAEIGQLNQEIADAARAIYVAAEPTERDRQAAIEQISELQVRRNVREERLLALMEEPLDRRPASTIDGR